MKKTLLCSIFALSLAATAQEFIVPFGYEEPWVGKLLFNSEGGYNFDYASPSNNPLHAWEQLYEAQSIILDKVEQKYKDVAKAINKTPSGKLDNIKDVLSDIRKNLGGALLDSISPALDALYQTLLNISDWIDTALGNNKKMSVAAAAIYETNRPSQFYGDMELDFSDIIEERVTQALADLAEMSILDIEMAQAKAKERYDRLSAVLDAGGFGIPGHEGPAVCFFRRSCQPVSAP